MFRARPGGASPARVPRFRRFEAKICQHAALLGAFTRPRAFGAPPPGAARGTCRPDGLRLRGFWLLDTPPGRLTSMTLLAAGCVTRTACVFDAIGCRTCHADGCVIDAISCGGGARTAWIVGTRRPWIGATWSIASLTPSAAGRAALLMASGFEVFVAGHVARTAGWSPPSRLDFGRPAGCSTVVVAMS